MSCAWEDSWTNHSLGRCKLFQVHNRQPPNEAQKSFRNACLPECLPGLFFRIVSVIRPKKAPESPSIVVISHTPWRNNISKEREGLSQCVYLARAETRRKKATFLVISNMTWPSRVTVIKMSTVSLKPSCAVWVCYSDTLMVQKEKWWIDLVTVMVSPLPSLYAGSLVVCMSRHAMCIEMTFLFKYTYTLFILFYSKMRPRKWTTKWVCEERSRWRRWETNPRRGDPLTNDD